MRVDVRLGEFGAAVGVAVEAPEGEILEVAV
jgi:hypothetical protein